MKQITRAVLIYAASLGLAGASVRTVTHLPLINVHANKHKQRHHHRLSVTTNREQILNSGATSISDFLAKQGIAQSAGHSSVGNQIDISMHGFGDNASQNSLVLVNGVPFASATSVGPNLNSILLNNISWLGIHPGSYGVRYGDQAVSGVLRIKTLIPNKLQRTLMLGVGNIEQRLGSVFVSKRFANHVGAKFGLDGYNTRGYNYHTGGSTYNLNTGLDYVGQKGRVALDIFAFNNYIDIANPSLWPNIQFNIPAVSHVRSRGTLAILSSDYLLANHWRLAASLSYGFTRRNGLINSNFIDRQHSGFGRVELHHGRDFYVGVDGLGDHYKLQNATVDNSANGFENSIYIDKRLHLSPKWTFEMGVRHAHQRLRLYPIPGQNLGSHDNATVSTAVLTWHISQRFQAYLRRDGNYRFAKVNEKLWVPANVGELRGQNGVSYEVGFGWMGKGNYVRASLFQLDLNNEIAYDPGDFSAEAPFGRMRNLPPTRRRGLDLVTYFTLTKHNHLMIQGSAVQPKVRYGIYANKQIPAVSPFRVSATLDNTFGNHWLLSFNETYNSPHFASDDLNNVGPRMPGYFLTNLYLRKQYKQAQLGIQVNNAFNKQYPRYAYMVTQFGGNPILYYPADGRSVLATLMYHF